MSLNHKKYARIIIIISFLVSSGFLFRWWTGSKQNNGDEHISANESWVNDPSSPCPGPIKEFHQPDVYMRGVVEKGQMVKVITNYYSCHPAKVGDIVLIQGAGESDKTLKIVRAIGGDKFKLKKDKKMNAWNIEINGHLLMDVDRPYFFGAPTAPTLALYEKSRANGLAPNEVLIFSSWAPGDRDSSIFGIYPTAALVGKLKN